MEATMEETQSVQAELMKQFPGVVEVRVQRARRVFAAVPSADFMKVFNYAVQNMRFTILCTITGLDHGPTLGAIYHLARESGVMLNLATSTPRDNPVLQTVSHVFPAADLYEREMIDLLGMRVEGLPPGNRYPLPDGWPAGQHPLRKDWKPDAPPAPPTQEVTDGKA